ncbi:MAG TPA: glycosyltransferase 87 family protein [Actinomycetales bacterium]|nr:glycosyltransferase 87 family protein [Actinomycetales bacterium]
MKAWAVERTAIRRWDSAHTVVIVSAVLAGFVARLVPVLRGSGLDGVLGYDDGVYFTGGAALVAGRMPYSDFTFLHPPGILLLMAPFAELGRLTSDHTGLAVARLTFMALGAVNAGLVAAVSARTTVGRSPRLAAAALGGLFYAFWFSSVYSTRTTLLPGVGTTCLLTALLLVWRTRPARWAVLVAGAALGFGACMKIWGVVPLAVVGLWVWRRHGTGAAARLAGGAVGTAVAVCGPFLLLAPREMVRMVLIDQLSRPTSTPSLVSRALDASSLHRAAPSLSGVPAVLVLVPVCLVVLACCAIVWRAGNGLLVLLLAATSVMLVTSPSYFTHYGEFVAAPLALVVAGAAGAWWARAGRRRGRLTLAVPFLVLLLELPALAPPFGSPLDRHALQQAVAGARCVATETPSMLAITDTLTSSLRAGCVVPVDVTGSVYDRFQMQQPDGRVVPRIDNAPYQRYLVDYLVSADAQVLTHGERWLITKPGLKRLHEGRLVERQGAIRVYRRP